LHGTRATRISIASPSAATLVKINPASFVLWQQIRRQPHSENESSRT
jgi:hypothetical protein